MNSFVEAAKEDKKETSVPDLVFAFVTGKNAESGKYRSLDGTLYDQQSVIARRSKCGTVLLPNASISDTTLNDALIGSLYANQIPFRRLTSFSTLLNSAQRVQDLRSGNYDDFRAIAKLFDFTVSESDIAAVEKSKAFTARVTEFFSKLEKEEADRVRTQQEKERAERVAREAIEWDTGKGRSANSEVKGSGGKGQRLRLSTDKKSVQGSNGHTYTVAGAKRVWDSASLRWHANTKSLSNSCYMGNRYVYFHKDRIELGCQTIYKEECERFADVMGWARKEPKAK